MNKLMVLFLSFVSHTVYANWLFSPPPKCDAVNDAIRQLLAERSQETEIDLFLQDINYIKEIKKQNTAKNTRYCSAIIQTSLYKFDIIYSIFPNEKGEYLVQLEEAETIIDDETIKKSTANISNQLADEKIKSFELAKKYGDMQEACLALRVAKDFYLNANNEPEYIKVNELLKENCGK